jgi:pyruvate dehydrogenase E1 component
VYNESYDMPAMPDGVREGIIRGIYPVRSVSSAKSDLQVDLLGSGTILNEVLRAQGILAERFGVASTVYSVTSYQQLRRDAMECERYNRLHPDEPSRQSYVEKVLGGRQTPVVASSDYMRAVPEAIGPYLNGRLLALGTDGFGRSETRKALRRFFEIDAECVTIAALSALAQQGRIETRRVSQAIQELGINPDAPAPWTV